jgi:hypothetical protein
MDQHPIPRQITTFEFKLIGFMTLRQFLYLVVFGPLGFIVYKVVPIPLINIVFAAVVILIGVALAFFKMNERPLDVMIKNLWKRLNSPTQYTYHKNNPPLYFLKNLYFASDPHKVLAHVESQEKLAAYLAQTRPQATTSKQKQQIQTLLKQPMQSPLKVKTQTSTVQTQPSNVSSPPTISPPSGVRQVFLTGIIRNNRQLPLPGILIYVKDQQNTLVRLLKTNPHGVFASYSSLPSGDYIMEIKDPNGGYFFDTMKISITEANPIPIQIYSKEML